MYQYASQETLACYSSVHVSVNMFCLCSIIHFRRLKKCNHSLVRMSLRVCNTKCMKHQSRHMKNETVISLIHGAERMNWGAVLPKCLQQMNVFPHLFGISKIYVQSTNKNRFIIRIIFWAMSLKSLLIARKNNAKLYESRKCCSS